MNLQSARLLVPVIRTACEYYEAEADGYLHVRPGNRIQLLYPGNKETAARTNCTVSASMVASRATPRVRVGCHAKSLLLLN